MCESTYIVMFPIEIKAEGYKDAAKKVRDCINGSDFFIGDNVTVKNMTTDEDMVLDTSLLDE